MKAYYKNVINAAVQVAEIFDDKIGLSIQYPTEVLVKSRYDAIQVLKQAICSMQYQLAINVAKKKRLAYNQSIYDPDLIKKRYDMIRELNQKASDMR